MTVLATLPLVKARGHHAAPPPGGLQKRESVVFNGGAFQYQVDLLDDVEDGGGLLRGRVKARILPLQGGYRVVVEGWLASTVEEAGPAASYQLFYDNGSRLIASRTEVGERYRESLGIAQGWLAREAGVLGLDAVPSLK